MPTSYIKKLTDLLEHVNKDLILRVYFLDSAKLLRGGRGNSAKVFVADHNQTKYLRLRTTNDVQWG